MRTGDLGIVVGDLLQLLVLKTLSLLPHGQTSAFMRAPSWTAPPHADAQTGMPGDLFLVLQAQVLCSPPGRPIVLLDLLQVGTNRRCYESVISMNLELDWKRVNA